MTQSAVVLALWPSCVDKHTISTISLSWWTAVQQAHCFFFLFLLPWCVRACLCAAVNLPEAGMWVIVAESVRRIWASKYCTLYFIYCMWESKQKETVLLFKSLWCSQETMMNSPSLNGIPRAVGMEAKIKSWNFFNKASLKGGLCVCVFVSKCYWCYDRAGKMKYQ